MKSHGDVGLSGPMLGCPSADGQALDVVNRHDVRAVRGTDIARNQGLAPQGEHHA